MMAKDWGQVELGKPAVKSSPGMGEVLDIHVLERGDVVMALMDLAAADVKAGTLGVVFEEANAYRDGGGPMVRWMNMNCCNVYNNQIQFVRR